ncbi:hypothetical protein RclHR1_15590004 [Rhizophagus clarus]|uniref:Uncharacterized protein n=1 Tax=Rhizophagus clarus TaxID=94130 RepID=A0A2Z6QFI3_9GLOM|nr:hypothetical protein RclHR1_15590004 [Rhizophagus clarus]
MNIYALFTFRIRGIVDQGMFIIKEESKNEIVILPNILYHGHTLAFSQSDQRSNWKLLYYQSISVMNICALFHIHDRGVLT